MTKVLGVSEIIDSKIKELDEHVNSEYSELEKNGFFKYQSKCRKIVLIATVIAMAASIYVLIAINEMKEFLTFQVVILIAYAGATIIPRYMLYRVHKRAVHINSMINKKEGFKWLKTRMLDQQEYLINIMKNRGLI